MNTTNPIYVVTVITRDAWAEPVVRVFSELFGAQEYMNALIAIRLTLHGLAGNGDRICLNTERFQES